MVGTAVQRGTGGEHYVKPRRQFQGGSTPHHARQQEAKQWQGEDPGKAIGQRGARGEGHTMGGAPDMTGRINLPSLASSSGRPPQSNLDRFLDVTAPRVKTQTLRRSYFQKSSEKLSCDPEKTPFFNVGDLWDSFDEWSAYGAGVPLLLHGDERVVQYYVPYLSALQLYTPRQPKSQARFRCGGSESDTGSETSSDGESESPPPHSGGPSGNSSMLKCKIEEDRVVWSYFEESQPYCRVPLVDKIADLSRVFEADPALKKENPLRSLQSFDLMPDSWFSVAWYPIYRIPTGPTLRDLAACFLTFHSLSTPWPVGDGSWRQSSACDIGASPTCPPAGVQPLKAFGLASYKLRGSLWSSNPEKRLAAKLEHNAIEHLTNLGVRHPDFDYFTSHAVPTRR